MELLSDPNLAFLLLLAGALALSWELHAPGLFLPGGLGIALISLGAYGIYQDQPTWYGVALLLAGAGLLAAELKFYSHGISGTIGALLLFLGATGLIRGPRGVEPWLAGAVATAAFLVAAVLGYSGMRLRKEPVLTGTARLLGEIGVARTDVFSHGTVLVRGEYWQAQSDRLISAGARVVIERVEHLLLTVRET